MAISPASRSEFEALGEDEVRRMSRLSNSFANWKTAEAEEWLAERAKDRALLAERPIRAAERGAWGVWTANAIALLALAISLYAAFHTK